MLIQYEYRPNNFDLLGLSHPVAPVLRLLVIVWIEVEIVEYHGVGRRQVDAQPPRPGW